jgi:hypothetical protein
LSIEELAKSYEHHIAADLTRIKLHEKLETDRDAIQWMMRRAIAFLGNGVEEVDGLAVIANGHRFEDLRFNGKPLERAGPDIHALLRDPFNPMSGTFSGNIREELRDSGKGKDTAWDELKDSLKTFGWLPEFPALVDERGVVLVGNRRMALAKELGIEPVKAILQIGKGDAADARRMRIAIASNIGSKKLSPSDRKRIAVYLYQEQDWKQQRIADALNVVVQTISNDLREFPTVGNSKRGRPRKEKGFEARVRRKEETTVELDNKVWPLLETGKPHSTIIDELDVGVRAVQDSEMRYVGQKRAKHTCPKCGHRFSE